MELLAKREASGGDRLLKPAEAAALVGYSADTIRRWALEGELTPTGDAVVVDRAGGKRTIPAAELASLWVQVDDRAAEIMRERYWPTRTGSPER